MDTKYEIECRDCDSTVEILVRDDIHEQYPICCPCCGSVTVESTKIDD